MQRLFRGVWLGLLLVGLATGCDDGPTDGFVADDADVSGSDTQGGSDTDGPDATTDGSTDVGTPGTGLNNGERFPQTACVPEVTWLGGTAPYGRGVARAVWLDPQGGAAVVGTSIGLERVDVSDPANPVGTAWLDVPGTVTAILLVDDALAVAADDTLYRVDPVSLAIQSQVVLPGRIGDLTVEYGRILATAGKTLTAVAVGPWAVDDVLPLSDSALYVAARNGLAAVTVANEGLVLVDLGSWVVVGRHPVFQRDFEDLVFVGNRLWVATPYEGLHGFDVTAPTEPQFIVTGANQWGWIPGDIVVVEERLYIGDRYPNPRLRVIDVSQPDAPEEVGSLPSPGDVLGLAVSGELLALASDDAGLGLASLAAPDAPTWLGRLDATGGSTSLSWSGDSLVVGDGKGGIRRIDPTTWAVQDEHVLSPAPRFAAAHGDAVYTLRDTSVAAGVFRMELVVHDRNDLSVSIGQPIEFGTSAVGLVVVGDTLLVAGGSSLFAFDVSTPQSPVAGDTVSTIGGIDDLVVTPGSDGPVAWVGSRSSPNGGVQSLVQGASPGSVEVLDSLSLPGYGGRLGIWKDVAVLASYSGFVQVIDVSDPSALVARGSARLGEKNYDVQVIGSTTGTPLAVLWTTHGVMAVDLSDRDRPLPVGSAPVLGVMNSMIAEDSGTWLAADGDQMVTRFEVTCRELDEPAAPTSADGLARVRLFNAIGTSAELTVELEGVGSVSAGAIRPSAPAVLPATGERTIAFEETELSIDFPAGETLLVATHWGAEPALLAVPEALPSGEHDASVRLVNITGQRVDGLLASGGRSFPLGALGTGSWGDAISVDGRFPARFALATADDTGFFLDVPTIAPGDRIVGIVSRVDEQLYVAWLDQTGLRAAMAVAGPEVGYWAVGMANIQLRVANLTANETLSVRVDGAELTGAQPLTPLQASEHALVPYGAVNVELFDGETSLGSFNPVVGNPGDAYTLAIHDAADGPSWSVVRDFSLTNTDDDKTAIQVLNAAWTTPVTVELVSDSGSVAGKWEQVAFGEAPSSILRPKAASYHARVNVDGKTWTFNIGYLPDYGQTLYFARMADGTPVATTQSGASPGFYWRLPEELLGRIRFVNLDEGLATFSWLAPDVGSEPFVRTTDVVPNRSTGWLTVTGGANTIGLGDETLEVTLTPNTWHTVFAVNGKLLVATEPTAPQSATNRVRLVNASDETVTAAWSGEDLGTIEPGQRSEDVVVFSKKGTLAITVGDETLAWNITGTGADPVLGLYYLGADDGSPPVVLVHTYETLIEPVWSAEGTSWARFMFLPTEWGSTTLTSAHFGLEEVAHPTGGSSQLPYWDSGPLPLAPGTGSVTLGGATTELTLEPGGVTLVLVWGDPASPQVLVVDGDAGEGADADRIINLSATGPADLYYKDAVEPLASDIPVGVVTPVSFPESVGELLLDYDQDGTADWKSWGYYGPPTTLIIHGVVNQSAMFSLVPSKPNLLHVGTWL